MSDSSRTTADAPKRPAPDRPEPGTAPHTGLSNDAAPGTSEQEPVVQGLHVPHILETDPRT